MKEDVDAVQRQKEEKVDLDTRIDEIQAELEKFQLKWAGMGNITHNQIRVPFGPNSRRQPLAIDEEEEDDEGFGDKE